MTAQLHHENTLFVKKQFPITLVCDRVNAPANIGSIFRIADSFGIEKIYFCGEDITVISKRMQRTARATHEMIPYEQEDQILPVIDKLQSEGYKIIGLEITKNSVPVSEIDFSANDKIALIIGDESQGISEEALTKTTKSIHINMYGTNSSMNVATATGIALYEITKQLMVDG
ncbi:TrmH family RNA methyltransferase [Aquimarina sp. BL5]|uniref:TrmH family RNA methyltransferase n=1 Tax=Aquimarina sp. BL5 TaxID=1714860 RepID=UPI000E4D57B1|nr:TrmH family RNA methyltransferase [Aquimarina sp. BL5]AXT53903.1 TrmH family RNA methyltransferase [Aquimarina sp. BL5]RKN00291.1 TrmH family RNA methyltransferase [Aquimarina sp. BL5]